MTTLFEPLQVGALSLSNRIVMAPMTRSQSPGAFPNENNIAYYRRRAEGQVRLIYQHQAGVLREKLKDPAAALRYDRALALLGLQQPWMLSPDAGHA